MSHDANELGDTEDRQTPRLRTSSDALDGFLHFDMARQPLLMSHDEDVRVDGDQSRSSMTS
jgi:hypothetical protein